MFGEGKDTVILPIPPEPQSPAAVQLAQHKAFAFHSVSVESVSTQTNVVKQDDDCQSGVQMNGESKAWGCTSFQKMMFLQI